MCTCVAVLWFACALGAPPPAAAAAARAKTTVDVSFDPAAFVRLRGQHFIALSGADVGALNELVRQPSTVRVERVADAPEADLDATRRRLVKSGRRSVPDLNRHYRIVTEDPAARDRLVLALRELGIVDEAVREPRPAPAPTGDYTALQRYGNAAPAGIGVSALAPRPGGSGQQAKIIDIEYSWNQAHEDLEHAATGLIPNGTPSDPFNDSNHGTAVLGELIGTDNAIGVTGLARASAIGMVNAYTTAGYAPATAIDVARQNLAPGDVLLLEQQTYGVAGSGTEADSYVPLEAIASVYDAIRLATQSGIIVIEAAGNGGVDLDGAAYAQPFPEGKADSGAIIVGAGSADATCSATPSPNSRLFFSTYGSRVNLQGWGQCVTTTGYGGLFDGGPNARYTEGFTGTSSASPIVAAAAALYASVVESETGAPPSPQSVRSRLIATGTPQGTGTTGHIGPLPDLLPAAAGTPPGVTVTGGPGGPTNDSTPTFAFTSPAPGATFECRLTGEPVFSRCTSPYTLATLPDGAATFAVRAIDAEFRTGAAATRSFSVDSTVAPGASGSDVAPGVPILPPPAVIAPTIGPGTQMIVRVGRGRSVKLPRPLVTCPPPAPACIVTLKANRLTAGKPRIASATLTIAAGKSAKLRFKLTKKARAALTRRGSFVATVQIVVRHGDRSTRRKLRVTFKR
ncbi:MAG: hypothetical protein QOG15_171 [Solirubrobacteraceae bacterium]|nr:hypothetical protein [Solirubrobacteraceae bacterium]